MVVVLVLLLLLLLLLLLMHACAISVTDSIFNPIKIVLAYSTATLPFKGAEGIHFHDVDVCVFFIGESKSTFARFPSSAFLDLALQPTLAMRSLPARLYLRERMCRIF